MNVIYVCGCLFYKAYNFTILSILLIALIFHLFLDSSGHQTSRITGKVQHSAGSFQQLGALPSEVISSTTLPMQTSLTQGGGIHRGIDDHLPVQTSLSLGSGIHRGCMAVCLFRHPSLESGIHRSRKGFPLNKLEVLS